MPSCPSAAHRSSARDACSSHPSQVCFPFPFSARNICWTRSSNQAKATKVQSRLPIFPSTLPFGTETTLIIRVGVLEIALVFRPQKSASNIGPWRRNKYTRHMSKSGELSLCSCIGWDTSIVLYKSITSNPINIVLTFPMRLTEEPWL